MDLVFYFILIQLCDQLHSCYIFYGLLQHIKIIIFYLIAFQQPEKIKVPEFGQKIFAVALVAVNIISKRGTRLIIFINRKKILAPLFGKLDLKIIVQPEIATQCLVYDPAKPIILYRCNNAQHSCI